VSDPQGEPFGQPKGLIAVLDTSVLVRAWLSPPAPPNPSLRVMQLAGAAYDSFTSPAILEELDEVLGRPSFGADPAHVHRWIDAFLRASRQVFPETIPGRDAGAVHGDLEDLPILKTAYATSSDESLPHILAAARNDAGYFLVSENRRHFTPGWNVYGWEFITADAFVRFLLRRGASRR
jgi:predicted nucleic acid-binding protein